MSITTRFTCAYCGRTGIRHGVIDEIPNGWQLFALNDVLVTLCSAGCLIGYSRVLDTAHVLARGTHIQPRETGLPAAVTT